MEEEAASLVEEAWKMEIILVILIYNARCVSVRPCVCPSPFSNMLVLLYKKFPKGETQIYLDLKARIARTDKLVISYQNWIIIVM